MSTPTIKTDVLSKFYGKVVALNQVSISLKSGVIGLLGPNGAGKSTFLRLMVGQLKPSKGDISTLGENPWRNLNLFRRLGYCPEHDAFYYWMTGRQFVNYMVRLYGYSKLESEKLANKAIKIVEMEEAADRAISGYSKGMKQRIKFAQAIAHDPELLFLDEPLAGADPLTRVKIISLIRDFGKEGRSVIVSSHILHEIEKMVRTILLVYQGKTLALGKINEIRDLIDKYPHEVKIRAENVRMLAKHLLNHPHVKNIRFEKINETEILFIKTNDPSSFYTELPQVLHSLKIDAKHISSTDDNLESVFGYLVR